MRYKNRHVSLRVGEECGTTILDAFTHKQDWSVAIGTNSPFEKIGHERARPIKKQSLSFFLHNLEKEVGVAVAEHIGNIHAGESSEMTTERISVGTDGVEQTMRDGGFVLEHDRSKQTHQLGERRFIFIRTAAADRFSKRPQEQTLAFEIGRLEALHESATRHAVWTSYIERERRLVCGGSGSAGF